MHTVKIISILIGISFISHQGSEFQALEVQEKGRVGAGGIFWSWREPWKEPAMWMSIDST